MQKNIEILNFHSILFYCISPANKSSDLLNLLAQQLNDENPSMADINFKNILFTRSISEEQRQFGKNMGLLISDFPFIEIELQSISQTQIEWINSHKEAAWIFTSQNAVRSISRILPQLNESSKKQSYAVGKKTALELEKLGIQPLIPDQHNAIALVEILKQSPTKSYIYFTGNLRRNTIINYFTDNEIAYQEIPCYQTKLIQPEIEIKSYDAICFCSPSAVISFFKKYRPDNNIPCIAIGNTTAIKLLEYTESVVLAGQTNIPAMLEICHNYLKL
ncbi:uroporphyrinogen-III synthase [Ancylomarina longa]|uniref:Uroporphyrinogen-III synthase n=1 Tax=Ancylomarina longa TaxID=2487017 RepID=A0A434AZ93_9BACT|nr:uroporphyrinogen-III synthase [Ancylomarina longa]RUT79856.1 uroporphyrinogen-III synthase [Ancylomarina longa]